MVEQSKWVSLSDAARVSALSRRTLDRLIAEKKIRCSRSPGGHKRVLRADLDRLLRPESPASVPASSALAAKRESVEALTLELQAERVKRDLGKLRAEDAEAEQRRAEAQRADTLANKRALEEIRLQQRRDAEERKCQKLAKQQEDLRRRWMRWASGLYPDWLSEDQADAVTEAVEKMLMTCDPRECYADLPGILEATIARVFAPWQAEREVCARRERLVSYALQWRLPLWATTDADKARAASAARAALSDLPLSASDTEMRAVADSAMAAISREIEERAKVEEAERKRKQHESMKSVLVSAGVRHVSVYLSELHTNGKIWDEDWERKPELEATVRKALEEKLTGEETFETAQKIACEIVDKELE